MTPRAIISFIRARREQRLDQLELHVYGAFNAAAFVAAAFSKGGLSASTLRRAMPNRDRRPAAVSAEQQIAKMDAWAGRISRLAASGAPAR
ncbi:MAG: hypothetical protein A2V88_15990 [Elusimicrobia bacterium RBG_16_66_12]|nr:MAG: hypothetical protein A2V88_15990 [Elusimicrobia bacterium RBG_16_66_12]